ncbi:MAG: carbohydrate ABC transporter permease [Spirochaetota bacterium]
MKQYQSIPKKIIVYVVLIIVAIWILFPFYWSLTNAFKMRRDQFRPGALIPWIHYKPTVKPWITVFERSAPTPFLINSIIVSITTTIIVMIVGTLAAYSLARFRFGKSGNKNLITFFLSQRVLPPVVVLIPFFVVLMTIKLLDTRLGLVLVYVTFNLPFGILIMRQMFTEIPKELEEAAYIDGASPYRAFYKVALPLSLNGLIATAVIVFAFSWNEALLALTLTSSNSQTLPVFILSSRSTRGVRFDFAAVNTLIAIGPPVIFSLLIQRYLAKGLTFGAVKG